MSIPNPILRFTDGTKVVDLLEDWRIADPYWRPQIAQYKRGGSFIDSGVAEGQRLVHKEYGNVIETIPLTARGIDQDKCIKTIRELLQLGRQAADYWSEIYEFDDVWLECKPPCNDCFTGYARVVKMALPDLSYPFGQPFFSVLDEAVMDGLTLTVEREPLWRGVPPGTIIGPLYNLIRNPDFELWNFGIADSQPDSWSDLETIQITGDNGRQTTAVHSGENALRVHVGGSTLAGRIKGVTQTINGTRAGREYTVIAWVRSDGVSNGVGRILVTYSSQLEVYRSATAHGWTLYTGKFTTGVGDTVAINCEILTTAANTDGTVYFDSLMLLEGDWEQEAIDGVLPYMSSSHVVNHWDQSTASVVEAGDINFVDVWAVPGDEDALIRLEFINEQDATGELVPEEIYEYIRIGQRRTGDVFNFNNYFDPPGVADTTASGDDRVDSQVLGTGFLDLTSNLISNQVGTVLDSLGRFRVLCRLYDTRAGTATLIARLKYFIGTAGVNEKTLGEVTAPIRGNWCILNLTPRAAMVIDQKFAADIASQFGYALQLRRSVGSDLGRLDYIMLMPTDGGYFEATITPPLTDGNALIIDNTTNIEQGINATSRRAGSRLSLAITGGVATVRSMVVFRGFLYFAVDEGGANNNLYRLENQQNWVLIHTFASNNSVMEVYNGELYVGETNLATGARLWRSSDGVTFSIAATMPTTNESTIEALRSFGGYLYIGTNFSSIRRWDGTTLTLSTDIIASDVDELEVYGQKLYAGLLLSEVWVFDPLTGNWSLSISGGVLGAASVASMKAFNGSLYVGLSDGRLVQFDGNQWIDLGIQNPLSNMLTMEVYNQKLYMGGGSSGDSVLITLDRDGDFSTYTDINTNFSAVTSTIFGGTLYLATSTGGDVNIYVINETDVTYKTPDFQGTPFTAPPKKRHRYFFSYDRVGSINNLDDKALIGLGFVPRYLSLRGHG